jgi:hypothetical protein
MSSIQTKLSLISIIYLLFSASLLAQAEFFAAGIRKEAIYKHLEVLTSDSLGGRETGTEGNIKATNYIARHFQQLNLPAVVSASYFQPIAFSSESFTVNKFIINEKEYAPMWDFYNFPTFNSNMSIQEKEILFMGYGIDDPVYSDYKRVEPKGKIILIYDGEPIRSDSTSWLTGTSEWSEWTTDVSKKISVAKQYGVKGIIIIDGRLQQNLRKNRNTYLTSSLQIGKSPDTDALFSNAVYISTTMAKSLIGNKIDEVIDIRNYIMKKGKTKSLAIETNVKWIQKKNINELLGRNVLGYIEGSDPKLKNELVVVTAHLDHLGTRGDKVFHGADDDASGTSAVMEIAAALADAKQKGQGTRRSVLCMLVTGEEKGLLGSSFYTKYPIFPLKNTIANVNIDMIGRIDADHAEKPNYVYVIGADKLSKDLHNINEMVNQNHTRLDLDYRFNDENEPNRYYYRSDHYNFVKNGIPAIFYFNGTHEDYHRPSDTIDKINLDVLVKRAKLAFYTTWELANRDERIHLD